MDFPPCAVQETEECVSLLEKECVALSPQLGPLRILPLHAGLGGGVQRIYEPEQELSSLPGGHGPEGGRGSVVNRKVVVADALAEASFSLTAVRYVIDTGLQLRTVSPAPSALPPHAAAMATRVTSAVLQVYNPQIRANSRMLRPISKEQADMRRQRVNSSQPGGKLLLDGCGPQPHPR